MCTAWYSNILYYVYQRHNKTNSTGEIVKIVKMRTYITNGLAESRLQLEILPSSATRESVPGNAFCWRPCWQALPLLETIVTMPDAGCLAG